jgi:hypothetical protein
VNSKPYILNKSVGRLFSYNKRSQTTNRIYRPISTKSRKPPRLVSRSSTHSRNSSTFRINIANSAEMEYKQRLVQIMRDKIGSIRDSKGAKGSLNVYNWRKV